MPPPARSLPQRTPRAAHHLHLCQIAVGPGDGHGPNIPVNIRLTHLLLWFFCHHGSWSYHVMYHTIWQLWPNFGHHTSDVFIPKKHKHLIKVRSHECTVLLNSHLGTYDLPSSIRHLGKFCTFALLLSFCPFPLKSQNVLFSFFKGSLLFPKNNAPIFEKSGVNNIEKFLLKLAKVYYVHIFQIMIFLSF